MKLRAKFAALWVAGATVAISLPASAYEAGDWLLRLGGAIVSPNDDSGDVSAFPGNGVAVDSAAGLGISLSYMVTPRLAIELLGASPFQHDIEATGPDLSALGKIADTRQLPPTLLANYQFPVSEQFLAYAGLGLNYTLFFDENTSSSLEGALGPSKMDLDDSFGLAVQLGADWLPRDNWFFNAALWYINIETRATIDFEGGPASGGQAGRTTVDVDINPVVLMLGGGYRF